MSHAPENPSPRIPGSRLEPVLWLGAIVLGVLALVRIVAPTGTLAPDAHGAGVVSQSGGLTVMTTEALNEDLLVVLDSRNEELFVYRTELKGGVQLLQRYQVPQLFVDARARSTGGP